MEIKAIQAQIELGDTSIQVNESIPAKLTGYSFGVGALLYLLKDVQGLDKIMLRGGWQAEPAIIKYLRRGKLEDSRIALHFRSHGTQKHCQRWQETIELTNQLSRFVYLSSKAPARIQPKIFVSNDMNVPVENANIRKNVRFLMADAGPGIGSDRVFEMRPITGYLNLQEQ